MYLILRCYGAALCIHDMIDEHPDEITADWVYLRFHGPERGGNYAYQALNVQLIFEQFRKVLEQAGLQAMEPQGDGIPRGDDADGERGLRSG
jgi:hypothetical protein